MDGQSDPEPVEVPAPAPILAAAGFAIGAAADWLVPVSLLSPRWSLVLGGTLVILGLSILIGSLYVMWGIDTSPSHRDEPSTLLTGGPFRITRHPLYLGLVVLYLGTTALYDSPWPLLLLVGLVWYFDRVAAREEAYLEARFGDEFRAYANSVRRWL